ncbi:MAG: glycogen/starch/alpha-glucan phosphorylase [Rhodospirillales bacterium]|nr:MAG: glycogen/starch/alpha-glucan phosphorylase [Rhodospirillales bacterium]
MRGETTAAKTPAAKVKGIPEDYHTGTDVDSLIRSFNFHLHFTLAKDQYSATTQDRYQALALAVRDRLVGRWIHTQQIYHKRNVKRVCYLSLEFLIGRAMGNNVISLLMEDTCREAMTRLGLDWDILRDVEVDAALGNGGLGRLAACFLDSMATLKLPAIGYGIRYDYGIFKQRIENGYQMEEPDNWLRMGNPWEIPHPEYSYLVPFGGRVEAQRTNGASRWRWLDTRPVVGLPYDMPVVGYGAYNVNTLRLWTAQATEDFDFQDFNRGSYVEAVEDKVMAENLTKVLYPSDAIYAGRELRLRQQYFFVSCSVQDIIRRFKAHNDDWNALPDKVCIQMNDTHPAVVVPELMRILIDQEELDPKKAWELTVNSTAYTNHTLLPEALERWPVTMFERLLPRHLQLIYEINSGFMRKVATSHPGDVDRLQRMSIIEEYPEKQVRMANLCIVGSKSTNGVAALHTRLLRERAMPDFAQFFPDRFNNKTNGVTPRRWLLKANPGLARLITEAIGDGWITDLDQLRGIEKHLEDKGFRKSIRDIKQANKAALADYIKRELDVTVPLDSMFDVQIKRIHEYKRQLLLCLYAIIMFSRLKENPNLDVVPRTFIFAGKAAPGYFIAKLIIKLINQVGSVVNFDPALNDKLKVVFLPDYRVSLAEKIIPAADLSEQISTAGMEASGTGNMKLSMNGALTIGTLDGANVEIRDEVGDENIFIFGLTAEEVADRRNAYNPWEIYNGDDEIRRAIDLIKNDFFSLTEPGIFQPLVTSLLEQGDYYMHLADLRPFIEAQDQVDRLYRDQDAWTRKAIINIARTGRFSSDRTIAEYARDIWGVEACEVEPLA